jgi:hypothetical protein
MPWVVQGAGIMGKKQRGGGAGAMGKKQRGSDVINREGLEPWAGGEVQRESAINGGGWGKKSIIIKELKN